MIPTVFLWNYLTHGLPLGFLSRKRLFEMEFFWGLIILLAVNGVLWGELKGRLLRKILICALWSLFILMLFSVGLMNFGYWQSE